MRKVQIGVLGSMADINNSQEAIAAAEMIGQLIAQKGGITLFGAEKDMDSLSTAACRGAKRYGGLTVGITYGKGKDVIEKNVDVIIPTGLDRGGGREFILALSCDAVISISGGSGTLNELVVAYQADIPMISLMGFGGWSDTIADTYFDGRQRRKVLAAYSPEDAVNLAFTQALKNT
jgi:uncharacterized protein (TIGR00725 family)